MSDSEPAARTDGQPSYVVAMGGSAGSLAAFQSLFGALQADSSMAFLVVTHSHPRHTRVFADILARFTSLPVRELCAAGPCGYLLESGTVYVAPSNRHVSVHDGRASLRPACETASASAVDALFRAVATDAGPRAIAVVLSGMGADGSVGLEVITRSFGQSFVQDPTSAAAPSMPLAAIAAGNADFVGTPDEIAETIDALDPRASIRVGGISVAAVLSRLSERHGHDFSDCKRSTVSRRIERRMSVHHIGAVSTYLDMLERDHGEVRRLVADLQISAR
jgi:two-component system CheB/CheR fusion protein